ncbi:MAG: serine/threonine protein kinase [Phormidesmis sp. RL_2_1]|nr:serine/threonine protein kinase [Phormidesmis sp. RL_2_1]
MQNFKPSPLFSPNEAAAQRSNYRLLGLVGQGQFAQVYCAIDRRTAQLVAIKQTRHASEQVSQESLVLRQLSQPNGHPNVVGAYSIAQTETGYQFILEYCDRGTLRSHLNAALPQPLTLLATKSLLNDILQGLSHIHQQAIIHGDLKPENILLSHLSHALGTSLPIIAKLADFGSAHFTHSSSPSKREIGSPSYAAPERFNGQSAIASDLYAVGVILYEMLLGYRPFAGSPDSLQQAHQNQPLPLPNALSRPAQELLTTALHKQPSQRFASANAMRLAIQQLPTVFSRTIFATDAIFATDVNSAITIPPTSIAQALTPICSTAITQPIEQLVSIPQGCCMVTQTALHLFTPQRQLITLARFDLACWVIISPNGRWFMTLSKQFEQKQSDQKCYTYYKLFNKNNTLSAVRPDKNRSFLSKEILPSTASFNAVKFKSIESQSIESNIIAILAIDARHFCKYMSRGS